MQVATELGIPPEKQRYWLWAKRQNHTFRPNKPMLPEDEGQRILDIKDNTNVKHAVADVKLLLEPLQPNGELTKLDKNDILLFFKLYTPETQKLTYAGCRFAHKNDRISSLNQFMCYVAGFPAETPLMVFEEIKYDPSVMCERISAQSTLTNAQLEHGDIICFQRAVAPEVEAKMPHPTVKVFLDYVRNRQGVVFKALESPKVIGCPNAPRTSLPFEVAVSSQLVASLTPLSRIDHQEDGCRLELSKENSYDEVCEAVAAELKRNGVAVPDAMYIRLTAHSCYSHGPKPQPIKYRGMDRLSDMLFHYNQVRLRRYGGAFNRASPGAETGSCGCASSGVTGRWLTILDPAADERHSVLRGARHAAAPAGASEEPQGGAVQREGGGGQPAPGPPPEGEHCG